MDAITCIRTRRSIRKFTSEQVPRKDLEEVIETATWSPSYKNTQPWEVVIVSGTKKKELSSMMLELLKNETSPAPDLAPPSSWPAPEQNRIDYLMCKRKELTGIDLTAPAMVIRAKQANFNFYHAPHAIYLFQDASLSEWSIFDIGLFAQSLMLAAHAKGLATVPQAFVTDYAKEVKECLGIPDTKRLIIGLSAGYPDLDSPVNAYRTERSDSSEFCRWLD